MVLGILFFIPSWEREIDDLPAWWVPALVVKWANYFGVDPKLALAIAWVESRWKPFAVSPKGAIGTMQIMPETAKYLYNFLPDWLKVKYFDKFKRLPYSLFDPDFNACLGVFFFSQLLKWFTVEEALSVYNSGNPTFAKRYALRVLSIKKEVNHVKKNRKWCVMGS